MQQVQQLRGKVDLEAEIKFAEEPLPPGIDPSIPLSESETNQSLKDLVDQLIRIEVDRA